MSYTLPFFPGEKTLEIGGGDTPTIPEATNLDIKPGPKVQIVADASKKPLPLKDGEYKNVFARYLWEHIGWRKTRDFAHEVFRILAPGGRAVFVIPDTLEQCIEIAKRGRFGKDESEFHFGSQDYESNAHAAGFSKDSVFEILTSVGFSSIIVLKVPDPKARDLIVEAGKFDMRPTVTTVVNDPALLATPEGRRSAFDKDYFNGGKKVGGYKNEGLRDFNVHWLTWNRLGQMLGPTESVLEIGCVVPGTEIIANPDVVPIENIEPGQRVLTHDGSFQTVTKLTRRPYSGDVVVITPRYSSGIPIILTPEHPVYAVRVKRPFRRWKAEIKSRPLWVPAADLGLGTHWLVIPKPKKGKKLRVEPSLARLCGYYLSEGWVQKKWNKTCKNWGYTVSFALHKNEVRELMDIRKLMKLHFGTQNGWVERSTRAGIKICFYSRKAHDTFLTLFGKFAKHKRVPISWIEGASNKALGQLIVGMYRGDGSAPDNQHLDYTTASASMAVGFRLVLMRLGILSEIDRSGPRNGGIIDGKRVRGGTRWDVRVSGINYDRLLTILQSRPSCRKRKGGRKYMFAREDENFFYVPMRSIQRRRYVGEVYNLEVRGAHSYALPNAIVHNCARGFILKRLRDISGVPKVRGLEISSHCWHTRVIEEIETWDICQAPWPIADKEFDAAISIATLEHIPEEHIQTVMNELARVSKRGIHGIDFGEHDDGNDKTHVTLRSQNWWSGRMPQGQIVIDKEALERVETEADREMLFYPLKAWNDGKVKLNIGCSRIMFHTWRNFDLPNPLLEEFAAQNGYKFYGVDVVTQGLPFDDGRVDLIYASHFLEHLPYEQGLAFLKECRRVLKKGGVVRIAVPDAGTLIECYRAGQLAQFDEVSYPCAASKSQAGKLYELLLANHKMIYDRDTLVNAFVEAGFREWIPQQFRSSRSREILTQTVDMFPSLSTYIEGVA